MKHSTTNVLIYAIAILICLATTQAQEKIFQEKKWEYSYKDNNGLSFINAIIVPGDTSVLVTDDKLGTIELDLMTGNKINDFAGKIKGGMAFSPDGKYLYTHNFEKVEWPSGKKVGMIEPHPNDVLFEAYDTPFSKLSFNFKTNRLVVLAWMADSWYPGQWIRGIRVYDLKDMKLIASLGEENTGVYSVRITNDGKYIVAHGQKFISWVATPDHSYEPELKDTMLLYDMETLKLIPDNDHRYKMESFIRSNNSFLSKDGTLIYYVKNNILYIVNSNTLEEIKKIKLQYPIMHPQDLKIPSIYISNDARLLLTNTYYKTNILDLNTGQLITEYYNLALSKYYLVKNNQYLLGLAGNIFLLDALGDSSSVNNNNNNNIEGVYPNPFKDSISISSDNFVSGNLEIILFDSKGAIIKTLFTGEYNAQDKLDFDLSKLSSGNYLILAYQNGITKTMKIVKE